MSERNSGLRRVQTAILSIVTVGALAGGGYAIYAGLRHTPASACRVVVSEKSYTLDPDQAKNAMTITAVGKRLGLPNHAVTVALAAAFQESNLHNLSHGDRDSLGLFQQRPSQGWGTEAQVTDPAYAAEAFFTHLAKVDGWETLAVNVAAQEVQRSAAPDAYTQWEGEARALAIATTGEAPAAFTCRASTPDPDSVDPALTATMTTELGSADLDARSELQGWTIASWLIANSHRFGITAVTFEGRRWTPSSGKWTRHSPTLDRVEIERVASA